MAGWLRVSAANSDPVDATRDDDGLTAPSPSIPASTTSSAGTHITRCRPVSASSLEKSAVSLHSPSGAWASTASRSIESRSMSGVVDRALSRRVLSVSAVQS